MRNIFIGVTWIACLVNCGGDDGDDLVEAIMEPGISPSQVVVQLSRFRRVEPLWKGGRTYLGYGVLLAQEDDGLHLIDGRVDPAELVDWPAVPFVLFVTKAGVGRAAPADAKEARASIVVVGVEGHLFVGWVESRSMLQLAWRE